MEIYSSQMNSILNNKSGELTLLINLMSNPQLLLDETYIITPDDFSCRENKILFGVISNLSKQGAREITPQDIEDILKDYPEQERIYRDGGLNISSLLDLREKEEHLGDKEQFNIIYNRIKKYSLLRDFRRAGFSIDNYFEQVNGIDDKTEIKDFSIDDCISDMKSRINDLELKYQDRSKMRGISAAEGLRDLIEQYKLTPAIGSEMDGEIYNYAVRGARLGKFYLLSAPSGHGKALPNSTLIPTPSGWRKVGDIKEGDYLFGADGKPTKVLKIFPQGTKQIYKVILKDGREVPCCSEHLWRVSTGKVNRPIYSTVDTKYLLKTGLYNNDGSYKYFIQLCDPVEYERKDLKIDPYVMGALIGDGSFRDNYNTHNLEFSSEDEQIPKEIASIMNWTYRKSCINNYNWRFGSYPYDSPIYIKDITNKYPELYNKYSYEKKIPEEYLYSSVEQRFALLQGLMDTDGSITRDGKAKITFGSSSYELVLQVIELIRSLGMISGAIVEDTRNKKYTKGFWSFSISCRPEQKLSLFRLNRKKILAEEWFNSNKRKEYNTRQAIVNIIKTEEYEEMTCFTVDNSQHLFLANDYIVTHNTRRMVGQACSLALPYINSIGCIVTKKEYKPVLFISTEQSVQEIQTLILAYVSGISEDKLTDGCIDCSEEELKRISLAMDIIELFKDYIMLEQIPDPSIGLVKSKMLYYIYKKNVQYIVFDYIFSSPNLLGEFSGLKLREDVVLMMFSNALKEIATNNDVFIMSGTQLSGDYMKPGFRGMWLLRGSKSVADKIDGGVITLRLQPDEEEEIVELEDTMNCKPNVVTDIYKNRSGRLTEMKIFSYFDYGTCRIKDLFLTDTGYVPSNDYKILKEDKEMLDNIDQLKERMSNGL